MNNVMVDEKENIRIIDIGGIIDRGFLEHVNRSPHYRRNFSTNNYFFKEQNGNVKWNDKKFDFFGAGKVL